MRKKERRDERWKREKAREDRRERRREPTKTLIESRLVRVTLLKKAENNSITKRRKRKE
jgi:hypothetical protein